MALTKCSECGKEFSKKATACPNCGAPAKKKRRWGKMLAVALFGFLVIGGIASSADKKKSPVGAPVPAATQNQAGSAAATPAPAVPPKNPCENIKTMDDWNNKTSTLWRNQHPECKPQPNAGQKTFTVMAASALWREFDQNEVAAENKYRNRQVAIEGRIAAITSSLLGYPEITFNVDQYGAQTVICQFPRQYRDAIATVSKGQRVVVIGTVKTFVLGLTLSLDDCSFAQTSK